jgi:hypothetical protein
MVDEARLAGTTTSPEVFLGLGVLGGLCTVRRDDVLGYGDEDDETGNADQSAGKVKGRNDASWRRA